MAAEVIWTEKASTNLRQIFNYIANDSHFYAERFLKKLVKKVESQLSDFPERGRTVPELLLTRIAFLREYI